LSDRILLDASPLWLLCHANQELPDVVAINHWLQERLGAGDQVFVPEVADYEVRRELIRAGKSGGVARLDALAERLGYLPLTTAMVRRAAEWWAQARNAGTPTADARELDCDVLLAAQAEAADGIVVTHNVGHLSRFVRARHWRDGL
jgi:predicted nucleic acid-binding protein